ncbi:cell division protein ZapB [Nitrospirota bacterium]
MGGLFDNEEHREAVSVNELKSFDGKILDAIVKIKALKKEKIELEDKVKELEAKVAQMDVELQSVSDERNAIKGQISDLLSELEEIEAI